MIKILVIGDIFGKKGRQMVQEHLPKLREEYEPDFIVANSENITHGKGPKMKHIQFLIDQGCDLLTGGNHSLVNLDDIREYLDQEDCIQLRPANYLNNDELPGKGSMMIEKNGKKLFVLNLLSNTFMRDQMENPFLSAQEILEGVDADAVVLDFHKEVTSEGFAMANLLDGQVSLVYGTHTHVQTNDEQIFPKGTGFISDVGFCGTAQSIIGVEWSSIKNRFLTGIQSGKMVPDEKGKGVLNGLYVEIENKKCTQIKKIRINE